MPSTSRRLSSSASIFHVWSPTTSGWAQPPWRWAGPSRRPRRGFAMAGRGPGGTRPLRTRLGCHELELPAQLDGEAEDDVFFCHRERLDRLDTPRPEPVARAGDELLRRRCTGGDPDRLDAVEPGLVDLGLVVDQVRLDAVR